MPSENPSPRQPSRWWLFLSVLCVVLAVGFAVGAIFVQRSAASPIGEGELFVADAKAATDVIESAPDLSTGVRLARNQLEVEAVSVAAETGVIVASTSENMVGKPVTNPLLAYGMSVGRFVALAAPTDLEIVLDGVPTWDPGSVLYQVVSPTRQQGSVLLDYDISELLARRVRPTGIQSATLELLALTAVFTLIGAVVLVGHMRASRRHREMERESDLLRAANQDLDEARARAERALELAEEKIRIRSEFVLMINHELRTPLTSVITGAKLLRESELSPGDRRHVLEAMVADGTRLEEMIDQILAVARIENRGLSYVLQEVTIDELEMALADEPARITRASEGHEEPVILTDLKTLVLVISSLTENARAHGATEVEVALGASGGPDPMIEIGKRPSPALVVTVADNGPGIDRNFLPRIFEKFEKSSFNSGTGLGLYMTRTIVEALEGSIGVDTSPSGTRFRITLPLATVRDPAVQR